MTGQAAISTHTYRNVFAECGYEKETIEQRLQDAWNKLFLDSNSPFRIYYPDHESGYVLDTGNNDVRSEGMSYGMMMAVQMGDKKIFDQIWRWAYEYMYHQTGIHAGYFAWHCTVDGEKIDNGPAPDGEEFFAMALFFAGKRWGNGEGIYNYERMAQTILSDCLHKGTDKEGHSMWNLENKLIKFVPELDYSDPSYHLPHFYELFSLWANEEDRDFWRDAASASRQYLSLAAHPVTGMTPEYAYYDGTPNDERGFGQFYSDSYRTVANIGLDYAWFGNEQTPTDIVKRLHHFFKGKDITTFRKYRLDGTPFPEEARHPVGLAATNAMGSLAYENSAEAKWFVDLFWETPLRKDKNRYYDNCLYFFAMLALSGHYRIWR